VKAKLALKSLPRKRSADLSLRSLPVFGRLEAVTCLRVTVPAGGSHPAVLHRRTDELAHVLAGSGWGFVGEEKVRVKAGDVLRIPAGARHGFTASAQGLEVLSVFAPALDPERPDVEEAP
jgi:quercetin dioxygenase-like cupin family protein